jgi:ferrous iron transport protein B
MILVVSVVVWLLSVLPGGEIETSFLAHVGRLLEPIGRLMGLDWRLMVALLTSFIAKENSIATLGVLFGSTDLATGDSAGLATVLAATFSVPAALAFLTVQMLFVPCVATVAVVRQETGSWGWTFFNLGFLLVVSFATGVGTFWLTSLIGL